MKAFPVELITQITGTRVEILAQTPSTLTKAYATDTNQFYIYDNGWKEFDTNLTPRSNPVDIGVFQDTNLAGYGQSYITDKKISNSCVGSNSDEKEGAIRVTFADSLDRNVAQYYLDSKWSTVLTGVNIQTDSEETPPDIEFTDFAPWILSLITGNSDAKDSNGEPLVKEMKTDMGAFSSPLTINGGSF